MEESQRVTNVANSNFGRFWAFTCREMRIAGGERTCSSAIDEACPKIEYDILHNHGSHEFKKEPK
jgi:hypothetical protein